MTLEPIFFLAGDYNINFLKIDNTPHFADLLDLFLGHSLFPKITLPTRIASNSCSFIDNIFCKLSHQYGQMTGGIFLHTMSDHYPYFVSCNLSVNHSTMKRPKYIKKRVNDKLAYVSLLTDLCQSNILNDMIPDPYTVPNMNYEILENHVTRLKNKHLPLKTVKFNKHKHRGSKWISRGEIRSIKYRDKLYRELIRTDRSSRDYPELQIQLKTYNSLLRRTIREAKRLYFNEQFNKNRSDVRKTWATKSEIIQKTKNKPSGIKYVLSEGKRISDPADIAEKINNFFIRMSSTLADKIKRPEGIHYRQFLHQNILSSFKFDLIDEKKLTYVARCLHNKSSSGKDGISLKLLKYLLPGLSKPLTLIINQFYWQVYFLID